MQIEQALEILNKNAHRGASSWEYNGYYVVNYSNLASFTQREAIAIAETYVEGIKIPREEYFKLRCDQIQLNLLENGGVDNWEWFGESLNPENDKSYEDYVRELKEEIFD